jgi:3-oxoacyl-[acyl-carrier-protein] synthase-3
MSIHADGTQASAIVCENSAYRKSEKPRGFTMAGLEVYNLALNKVGDSMEELLSRSKVQMDQIDAFVFHQANMLVLEGLSRALRVPMARFPLSLQNFGNTAAASIPLTLVTDRLNKKNMSAFYGFGSGFSWGTACVSLQHTHFSELQEYANA